MAGLCTSMGTEFGLGINAHCTNAALQNHVVELERKRKRTLPCAKEV